MKMQDCSLCHTELAVGIKFFLPMYQGEVIDTNITDDWAAMPCCEQCYLNHRDMWDHMIGPAKAG